MRAAIQTEYNSVRMKGPAHTSLDTFRTKSPSGIVQSNTERIIPLQTHLFQPDDCKTILSAGTVERLASRPTSCHLDRRLHPGTGRLDAVTRLN